MNNFNALLVTVTMPDGNVVDSIVEVVKMIDVENIAMQLNEDEMNGKIKRFNINKILISNVQQYTRLDD